MLRAATLAMVVVGIVSLSHDAAAQGICPPQPLEILSPSPTYEVEGSAALLDGDRLAVNLLIPPLASPPQAVGVFQRDLGGPGAWGLQYTVLPPGPGGGLWAEALDQDTLVARDNVVNGGFQDAVYVYQLNPGINDWALMKTLSMDVSALELEGDTLVIDIGSDVEVRERHLGGTNQWGVAATLSGPSPSGAGFGGAMSLSGDVLAVSYVNWVSSASDSVTLFERSGGTWSLAKVLYQPNGFAGQWFGKSVALEGDTLLAGASGATVAGAQWAGAVFVFSRDQGGPDNWGLVTKIKPPDPTEDAFFGSSVSLSGDLALIGEPGYSTPTCTKVGQAHLMQRDHGGIDNWGHVASFPWPEPCEVGVGFGSGTIDGSTALIGTPGSGNGPALLVYDEILASCPMTYCTAGTSANGCQAFLDASGAPSASASSGFTLGASGVEGDVSGLFFFGSNGRQANPWGNGTSFQCVVPPVQRCGLLTGSGTAGLCDGTFGQDLNALWCASCPKPAKNPGAGAVVQAQLWYRDAQSTSNQTTSLSDAIEFTMGF